MNDEYKDWQSIDWKSVEMKVFKLQKRIFRAKMKGNMVLVKNLQRLLVNSHSAKALAVRKVTQDNRGKRTAGIDGKKALTPIQRMKLLQEMKISKEAKPLRRIYIPKPNGEKRPLSIPTIKDRAIQMLVTMALEPEWEAVFEPNSYGFRKGRNCHDAIEAIFNQIRYKQKWVLDADIAKCFDKISHNYLLEKLGDTLVTFKHQIKAWLKAGFMDKTELFPSTEGAPQGGIISPLLANIALHGIENHLNEWVKTWKGNKEKNLNSFSFIRYADDFVCIHESREIVEKAKELISQILLPIGLELKSEKTQVVHTSTGFDFLGFNIRQYQTGKNHSGKNTNGNLLGFKTLIKPSEKAIKKHYDKMADCIRGNRSASQEALITLLNPVIRGWCNYYQSNVSKETFSSLDYLLYGVLRRWTLRRHPNKNRKWVKERYYHTVKNRNWVFKSEKGYELIEHAKTPIKRYVKVKGTYSPFNGDTIYWAERLAKSLELTTREQKLIKIQQGYCPLCREKFKTGDLWEIDHIIPRSLGGKDRYDNLQLIHAHCHDKKTRTDVRQSKGTREKSQIIEEPCEIKVSSTVLKTGKSREVPT